MNILGIDTTTKTASCTIFTNNKYTTTSVTNEITHSEKLLPLIDDTLKKTNLKLNDINLIATINGPGSFTGLRIGLATIKAFSQITGTDIFSISSLDLISYLAYKKSNNNTILSIIDAKNNRVFYELVKINQVKEKVVIERIVDIQNDTIDDVLAKVISNLNEKITIAGNCTTLYSEKLKNNSNCILELYPTTEDLIDCYFNLKNNSSYIYNAYNLEALYARLSQAERLSNEEHNNN